MDIVLVILLATCSFILGGCPFSVWIGRLAMSKDIRQYGDGNPGSYNVFKAGSKKWGVIALLLDIIKGIPFILIGKTVFGIGQPFLYLIALCAVLGHAYSPFLGFRGGKALAVFAGTIFGLTQWDVLISLIVLCLIGFLFIGNDAWTVMLAMGGTLIILLVTHADIWTTVFICCVSILFAVKQFHDLGTPINSGRLINWIKSRRKAI